MKHDPMTCPECVDVMDRAISSLVHKRGSGSVTITFQPQGHVSALYMEEEFRDERERAKELCKLHGGHAAPWPIGPCPVCGDGSQ